MARAPYRFPEYTPGPFGGRTAVARDYRNLARDYLRYARAAEREAAGSLGVRHRDLARKWRAEAAAWRKRARRALDRAREHTPDPAAVQHAWEIAARGFELRQEGEAVQNADPAHAARLYGEAGDQLVVAADEFLIAREPDLARTYTAEAADLHGRARRIRRSATEPAPSYAPLGGGHFEVSDTEARRLARAAGRSPPVTGSLRVELSNGQLADLSRFGQPSRPRGWTWAVRPEGGRLGARDLQRRRAARTKRRAKRLAR